MINHLENGEQVKSYYNLDLVTSLTRGCVTICVALPFYIKKVSYGKRRIMKTQNISPCKNITFKKVLQKKPKSFKIL
jgi:hypothetical protein